MTDKKFCKKNVLIILTLSVTFGFTVFFFTPIQIFINNQTAFSVGFKTFVLTMFVSSAVVSLIAAILFVLILQVRQNKFASYSRLFFGWILAMYVQSLFFNKRTSPLTGDDLNYDGNKVSVVINLIVFCLIIFLPLILHGIVRTAKNCGKDILIPCVSGVIFIIQLVGTCVSVFGADLSGRNGLHTKYLAIKPTLSLSEDENIVVFLTDRLDGLWADEILELYPDMADNLEGFTFYQNNVAHNTNTFPSVPQMLTNSYYKGEEWVDYIACAWNGNTLPKILTENGYDVNLLIDNLTTYSSLVQLDGQCHNISECPSDDIEMNYMGMCGIIPKMFRLSMSRLSPYALKSGFISGSGTNISHDFVIYTDETLDCVPASVGAEFDLKYYDCLKQYGLNADNKNKIFSFVHLNGAHGASSDIAALYDDSLEVNVGSSVRGDFQIIFEYIEEMKRLGVYDNSTIIILGDHGRVPVEIEEDNEPGLTSAITTALFIKSKNAPRTILKVDRNSELSNDFFFASILEYAGIDHKEFGYSYNDIVEGRLHIDRYMQTFDGRCFGKIVYKNCYKITGDARDFDNWEAIDR